MLLILLLQSGFTEFGLHSNRDRSHCEGHCRLRLDMINIGLRLIMINVLVLVLDRVPTCGRSVRRWTEDPGVLAAAALAAVDDQLSLGQRHAGEAPGKHPYVFAVVDRERSKIRC